MGNNTEQIDFDFEGKEPKLLLAGALKDLISTIEGSLPNAHLRSILSNKTEQALGRISDNQREAITQYVEAHPSYSQIDPYELASKILDSLA
ncbi:MAG: hypothetical protein COT25_04455 [Candidatus Kerfeldbacteria bacterium CG08_land_8_20_14_0_20_42_7]|uniref:Uncharacterized protein n=1 Tax=Candidatus Kerfeldbacteria bacterium CG08_land_8_20_14_0_20_42_7 TaxID=2014245 RepID=A0A2H0YTX4_9BACT|nr:MAG: hypothetical protein COT25_04455 [Candidatus Kerfeldbacteria bacterium CG08_land_8_20_14_0_20_42_7]